MKYVIGEDFILDFPVKVVAVDLDQGVLREEVRYTVKGTRPDGTKMTGYIYEPIEQEVASAGNQSK